MIYEAGGRSPGECRQHPHPSLGNTDGGVCQAEPWGGPRDLEGEGQGRVPTQESLSLRPQFLQLSNGGKETVRFSLSSLLAPLLCNSEPEGWVTLHVENLQRTPSSRAPGFVNTSSHQHVLGGQPSLELRQLLSIPPLSPRHHARKPLMTRPPSSPTRTVHQDSHRFHERNGG